MAEPRPRLGEQVDDAPLGRCQRQVHGLEDGVAGTDERPERLESDVAVELCLPGRAGDQGQVVPLFQAIPGDLGQQADKDAAGPTKRYDDQYFDRFFANARELLEQQITRSISATAALITGAWEAAGKPTVRVR